MPDRIDLRYGLMAGIYYEIAGERLPRQLDLLDSWFPELFVVEDPLQGVTGAGSHGDGAVTIGHPNGKTDKPKAYYDD